MDFIFKVKCRYYLVLDLQCRHPVLWSERAVVWLHRVWACSGDPHHSGPCEPHRKLLSPERRPCNSRSRAPSAPVCTLLGWLDSHSISPACRGHRGLVLVLPLGMTSLQPQMPLLPPPGEASHIIQTSLVFWFLCSCLCLSKLLSLSILSF